MSAALSQLFAFNRLTFLNNEGVLSSSPNIQVYSGLIFLDLKIFFHIKQNQLRFKLASLYIILGDEEHEDSVFMRVFLTPSPGKNGYGDQTFYDADEEIITSVHPRMGR